MHSITLIALIALLPIAAPAIAQQSPAVVQQSPAVAVELRCEYLTNPVGIDAIAPRLSWRMHDARRGAKQAAYQVLVAGSPEVLAEDRGDLWDSGKVDSAQSIGVAYGGKRLSSATRAYWKVRLWDADGNPSAYSEPARWEMALLSQDDWRAKWICSPKPLPTRDKDFYKVHPAPLFRKSFSAAKPIRRATVYVSGLGYYELSINGRRVGDRVLDPAWTTYSKRVLYSTFDVTDMLAQGENVLAAVVGNGWYNPLPMRMWGRRNLREALTIGRPRLILQLNLEYADGSRESVVTDETWKTADGPILKNSIYLGELYDARREQSGWQKPAFDESDWQAAVASTEPLGPLRAQAVQPIMVTRKIKAVRLTEPKPGVFVFDLGQNFTGWARLRVSGKAGAAVTMTMGVLLFDDGLVNARTAATGQITRPGVGGPGAPDQALQKNTYVLKGSGEEVYTPRFTFHGFRYVQVEGFPGKATLDAIEGLRTNSAVAPAGSFQCSNERFNRIYGLFDWTLLSNLQGVQSDCPHREKFGYGGDIVACDEAVILGFDMAAVYAKTIEDFNDAARDNGGFTETAPFVGIRGGLGEGAGPVGWGTAHPLLQWHLLQYYGNRRILEQQYEATKRWLNLLQKNAKDHILNEGIGDHESLARAPRPLTGTAFYYYNIRLGQRIAAVLGHRDDAERYGRLADDIRDALNNKFLDKTSGT
ncbi:MAG: family 78 glycoside hydrolase catalytic domain, partial [Thermoguttaceae bacterium]